MRSVRFAALTAAALALPLAAAAALTVPAYDAKAVADAGRPADDKAQDEVRKPGEVLAFSGVKPGQHVAEFLPGGGYYTRMLIDVVGPNGKVYALETSRWGQQNVDATKKAIDGHANASLDVSPFGAFNLPEKVDVFWTTLNYHDLHVAKYGVVDMAAFNKHVYDSLKPGGVYFITDHDSAAGAGDTKVADLHRIEKATVVKEVTAAGFRLEGESDVLRRATDDHSKPVFDLKLKTDQFVLKFRKPA
jgi:predicted methyltransferase